MTAEQMERAIEFLLNSQAQTSADVRALVETVSRLENQMDAGFTRMEARMDRFEAQAESDRVEIREAIENLILANEVTRKLSEDVARLNVQTSQRVTEQGKEMDARLDALISIVERHITNPNAHEGEE